MCEKNGDWWKGSFPTWIVAILLALLGFFMKREVEENDLYRVENSNVIIELKVEVASLKTRISSLESTVHENHQLLMEIGRQISYDANLRN